MSEDNKPDEVDQLKFEIGFDSTTDPERMMIQIPIREWALDLEHGAALFHGHMREAEAKGMAVLRMMRQKKQEGGLITPAGAPAKTTLSVH